MEPYAERPYTVRAWHHPDPCGSRDKHPSPVQSFETLAEAGAAVVEALGEAGPYGEVLIRDRFGWPLVRITHPDPED